MRRIFSENLVLRVLLGAVILYLFFSRSTELASVWCLGWKKLRAQLPINGVALPILSLLRLLLHTSFPRRRLTIHLAIFILDTADRNSSKDLHLSHPLRPFVRKFWYSLRARYLKKVLIIAITFSAVLNGAKRSPLII